MSDTIAIRPATTADLEAIVRLMQRGFADERPYFDETTLDEVKAAMHENLYLAGVDDQARLIGTVCVYQRPLSDGSRRFGELVVEPSMRRRGYGRQLLVAAEDRLRRDGCTKITIGVLNFKPEETFRLYRVAGYRETGQQQSPKPPPKKPCVLILLAKTLA